jgi:hypothetical protein
MKKLITILVVAIATATASQAQEREYFAKIRGHDWAQDWAFFSFKNDRGNTPQSQLDEAINTAARALTAMGQKPDAALQKIFKDEANKTLHEIVSGITDEEFRAIRDGKISDDHIRRIIGIIPGS